MSDKKEEEFDINMLRPTYLEFVNGGMKLKEFRAICEDYGKSSFEVIKYFEFEMRIKEGARTIQG